VQGVAEGDQAQAGHFEGHGAFHGAAEAIAGFADSEDLSGVGECLLDSPAGCIAGYHIFGR
jgi:hypothetical protein